MKQQLTAEQAWYVIRQGYDCDGGYYQSLDAYESEQFARESAANSNNGSDGVVATAATYQQAQSWASINGENMPDYFFDQDYNIIDFTNTTNENSKHQLH